MRKYPIVGVAIGAMQVADAAILFFHECAAVPVTLAFAIIEFVWAIVSVVVLFRVTDRPTRILAGIFCAYNLVGWLLAAVVYSKAEPVTVPVCFVVFGGLFGAAYAASALRISRRP